MALDLLSLLVAGAGAGWGYLSLRKYGRQRHNGLAELERAFDGDATVVFSVAMHAMKSRGHEHMVNTHLIYGLLQDDSFTGAVKQLGGDPEALETDVLGKLDALTVTENDARVAVTVLNYCAHHADATDRKITICDLWAGISRTPDAAIVSVDKVDLLFLLEHGMPQPPPDLPGRTDVQVVLRNDQHMTFELVIGILVDLFSFSADDAKALAMEIHKTGRGAVGRYKLPVARDKVIAARSRAREKGFPLWVALEDV